MEQDSGLIPIEEHTLRSNPGLIGRLIGQFTSRFSESEDPQSVVRQRVVRKRKSIPRKKLLLRIENDQGGPTSIATGPATGIGRIVTIAHNQKSGLPLDTDLENFPDVEIEAEPKH